MNRQNPAQSNEQFSEPKPSFLWIKILLIVIICAVLFGFGGYYLGKQKNKSAPVTTAYPTSTPSPIPTIGPRVAQPGGQCGTIAGIVCPTEYVCKYEGNYPDAAGVCVK